MEILTLLYIGYIVLLILIVEYIYWCRYLPNMRRLAQNNYQDL
jgi:hypothetical protein